MAAAAVALAALVLASSAWALVDGAKIGGREKPRRRVRPCSTTSTTRARSLPRTAGTSALRRAGRERGAPAGVRLRSRSSQTRRKARTACSVSKL